LNGAVTCALVLLPAALVLAASDTRDVGSDRIDVSAYPKRYQEQYGVFALKCSKCHTLARPINARLEGDEWKSYIKKMIRRPGSGINEQAGQNIYEFLKFYTAVKKGTLAPDGGQP
jgi:hypothetical protein